MEDVLLKVTEGLPYGRRIRVVQGALTWPTLDDFEVRSHIRVGPDSRTTLKSELTPYLRPSIETDDIVIDLVMTAEETQKIKGGFYDIVISDKGDFPVRALRILKGQIRLERLITGD